MRVAISPSAGIAIVMDGDTPQTMNLDGELRSTSPEEARRACYGEYYGLLFEDCQDLDEVRVKLRESVERADALQTVLILLDPELSEDVRVLAGTELENYLQQRHVNAFLEGVFSKDPPRLHDMNGAMKLSSGLVHDFLDRVCNPSIEKGSAECPP